MTYKDFIEWVNKNPEKVKSTNELIEVLKHRINELKIMSTKENTATYKKKMINFTEKNENGNIFYEYWNDNGTLTVHIENNKMIYRKSCNKTHVAEWGEINSVTQILDLLNWLYQ